MNAREWIDAYAARMATEPPSESDFTTILELAGEAAHASERVAAPAACWVAARSGRSLEEALAVAREVSE